MVEERLYTPEEEPLLVTEPVKEEEEEGEDLSDMFEVPKQGYEKEDLADLFEVSEEDVMGEDEGELEEEPGEEPEPEPVKVEPHWSDEEVRRYEESLRPRIARKPLIRRTTKRYIPPDQISGMRGGR